VNINEGGQAVIGNFGSDGADGAARRRRGKSPYGMAERTGGVGSKRHSDVAPSQRLVDDRNAQLMLSLPSGEVPVVMLLLPSSVHRELARLRQSLWGRPT